ncbi:hypothetical protein D3C71_1850760 [compost metagenome]
MQGKADGLLRAIIGDIAWPLELIDRLLRSHSGGWPSRRKVEVLHVGRPHQKFTYCDCACAYVIAIGMGLKLDLGRAGLIVASSG